MAAAISAPRPADPSAGVMGVPELVLTLVVLVCGGVSSLLIVAATSGSGLASMTLLFWAIDIPAAVIIAAVYLYARSTGLDRLQRRIFVGVLGGIVLTMALDVVRSAGVHLGYLPDSITMFGNLITGASPMAHPTVGGYLLGNIYHLFNGISFALVYSIAFGRTRWWGPVLFSVFVWTGMMLLPPMAPMLGRYGLAKYPGLINGYSVDTLLAHLAMGLALAATVHCAARDRGLLLAPTAALGALAHPAPAPAR